MACVCLYPFGSCSYIFKSFQFAENRCIELHSPDGVHSCLLRASDSQEAQAWFNALHSAIARSTQRALLDANRVLAHMLGELKHIGWLSRRLCNEQVQYSSIIHIFTLFPFTPFPVHPSG